MLTIISPAKTFDYESPLATTRYTQPELLDKSNELINAARKMSPAQISLLMGINSKLACLNTERFNDWRPDFNLKNARQALLAFKGSVYTGLKVENFSGEDFDFAQKHLRMLSGLYGLLRPLDLIMPYRLEMSIRLENPKGTNLYEFWGNSLTEKINLLLSKQKNKILVNLASDEYFKAVKTKLLDGEFIKPVFLDERNGQYKVISFYAKKARGLMGRFIIKERLDEKKQFQDFNLEGYTFDESRSQGNELVFTRPERLVR